MNTLPLTEVAKKPMMNGLTFSPSRWARANAFTRRQAVRAPLSSLAIFPRGKADLEEGIKVSPATNPMPKARVGPGLVRLMVMEYMAMVQLGVTPPTLGLMVWRMTPMASSSAVIATQRWVSRAASTVIRSGIGLSMIRCSFAAMDYRI